MAFGGRGFIFPILFLTLSGFMQPSLSGRQAFRCVNPRVTPAYSHDVLLVPLPLRIFGAGRQTPGSSSGDRDLQWSLPRRQRWPAGGSAGSGWGVCAISPALSLSVFPAHLSVGDCFSDHRCDRKHTVQFSSAFLELCILCKWLQEVPQRLCAQVSLLAE